MGSQTAQNVPPNRRWRGGGLEGALGLSLSVLPFALIPRVGGGGGAVMGEQTEAVGGEGQGRGEGVKQGPPPRPEEFRAPPGTRAPLAPQLGHLESRLSACPSSPVSPPLRGSVRLCLPNVTAARVPQPWQDRPQWNFETSSGTHELLVNINSARGERRQTPCPRRPRVPGGVRRPGTRRGRGAARASA